jgi:hypothetical protein
MIDKMSVCGNNGRRRREGSGEGTEPTKELNRIESTEIEQHREEGWEREVCRFEVLLKRMAHSL